MAFRNRPIKKNCFSSQLIPMNAVCKFSNTANLETRNY